MVRYGKVDDNQDSIVQALQQAYCNVYIASNVGGGFPDLLVCRANRLYLLEVKDGAKSASRRKLTPAQERFHGEFPVSVVKDINEALTAVGITV